MAPTTGLEVRLARPAVEQQLAPNSAVSALKPAPNQLYPRLGMRRWRQRVWWAGLLAVLAPSTAFGEPSARLTGDAVLNSRSGSAALAWELVEVPQAVGAAPAADQAKKPRGSDGKPIARDAQRPEFQLQRAAAEDFSAPHTLYTGADQGRYVSGLETGTYHFRVRARLSAGNWGEWSKPQRLVVEHWPVGRALGLMLIGGLVFFATGFVVVRGAARAEGTDD